jgi:peptidoglycan/xylan/chitin deacetylase (PgdA/CDA1 family)
LAIQQLHARLKDLPHSQRHEIVESVVRRYGKMDVSRIMMNWDELREMTAGGLVTVGGHTLSHPILTRIAAEEARDEISGCKAVIESELRCPVRFFAYPNGRPSDISQELMDMVHDAGYTAAFSMTAGPNYSLADRFRLKRTAISNGTCRGVTGVMSDSMLAIRVRHAFGGAPFRA